MKRFLLIDDHVVVRSGIRILLSDMYSPSVIEEAHNGETALEKVKESVFDLVMLDIQMPNTDTLGLMEFIRNMHPHLKVLIFSMSPENIYAKRFLKAGAKGFLSKDAPLDEIRRAIDLVLGDKTYISESFMDALTEKSGELVDDNAFNKLSAREFEIVSLLLTGQTISQIGNTLNLQVSTIGTHKARIFGKLKVNNILELRELANAYKLF